MKSLILASFICCAATSATMAQTAPNPKAGIQDLTLEAPHHNKQITGTIMYPTHSGGTTTLIADNPVFQGFEVQKDADIKPGKHPIVLLSHGLGGNTRSIAWLGAGLAERGAIVISVNHPNTSWGDFDLKKGVRHWTRAQDLSAALDRVSELDFFNNHIDTKHIMSAGFSYGGHTSLLLAGLTGNHHTFVRHCQSIRQSSELCDRWLQDEIGLTDIAPRQWNASYKDDRVTHAFAIDPGLVYGYGPDNVANLVENITVVGLGDVSTRLVETDFEKSGLDKLIPQAQSRWFIPAFHFTAMPLCKPAGEKILKLEQDDPVCTDPKGTNRAQVHQELIEMMAIQLGL